MPIFLLIRHAETDYNKKSRIASRLPGVHLNLKGKQQAQQLADKLANAPIKAIHSSPLERAIETAEPLARALNLEIVPNPGLLESDCGEWQGKSVKKLQRQKIWQSIQQHPSLFHFPGGEWIGECQHRMVQVLETLRHAYSPQDLVACFSHADPIKQLIAYYLGLPLDNYQRLSIDLVSITALQITEAGARLFVLNYNPVFSGNFFQPPKNGRRKAAIKS
jgi:probable phosphomutase (TIGR03848 family)